MIRPRTFYHWGVVLIVDDYPAICRAIERLARVLGADAKCVTNAADAMEIMRRKPPSLVVLNDAMPDVSGVDLLRSIRADVALRGVPVVMYSGGDDPERRAKAAELGALGWVLKNGHFNELKKYIARYSA